MKKLVTITLIAALLLGLTACSTEGSMESSNTANSNKPKEQVQLVLGSGPIGGALYPIAGGIAAIVNEYVDGVNISVQVTAGGVENTRLVGSGELDLGLAAYSQCYEANNGIKTFEGEDLAMSVLGALHSTVGQIVVLADSDIYEFQDLKGKTVAVGEAGGGAAVNFNTYCEAIGWTDQDVNTVYIAYDQATDQLGDGQIDACVIYAGLPASSITNLDSRHPVRLVNINQEMIDAYVNHVDVVLSAFEEVPAGSYTGMNEPVVTEVAKMMLCCRDGFDEELAYEITKALYDHIDELYTYHAAASSITAEGGATILGGEFNPGAAKYFSEKGFY